MKIENLTDEELKQEEALRNMANMICYPYEEVKNAFMKFVKVINSNVNKNESAEYRFLDEYREHDADEINAIILPLLNPDRSKEEEE